MSPESIPFHCLKQQRYQPEVVTRISLVYYVMTSIFKKEREGREVKIESEREIERRRRESMGREGRREIKIISDKPSS